MPTIGALDVRNQCSGFIYSLSVADQFIKTGMYKNVLVIGSENHSGGLERSTRGRGVTVILEMEQEQLFYHVRKRKEKDFIFSLTF